MFTYRRLVPKGFLAQRRVVCVGVKLVLNWANFSSRAYLEVFVETIFGVRKASLNMFWEHSPYSTIIASDWLRAELSCG